MLKYLMLMLVLLAPSVQAETVSADDENEPQVTIRHDAGKTYYEYRVGGELREIKVVPEEGKPYYLVPAQGEFIRHEESQLLVPKWILFSW